MSEINFLQTRRRGIRLPGDGTFRYSWGVRVTETQSRVVYSLLKPAIRAAAHFGVPIRTLTELVRLAYFEELKARDLSNAEIATVFGQTERHMRSLAGRLETDFFAAERDVGLVREVEADIASAELAPAEIVERFAHVPPKDVEAALRTLLSEGRVEQGEDGKLRTAKRYVTLKTDGFSYRIDAINHFLDGGYRAVLHRLIFNDERLATLKTISFSAMAHELQQVWSGLEGSLRRELAQLDESASFSGHAEERYTIALALAPVTDEE